MIKRAFTEHPESVGETYAEHMGQAASFGGWMILGGLACLIHGLLPFAFKTTGSKIITRLHGRMVTHRDRRESASSRAPAAERTA